MAERHPREAALRRVHGSGALFSAAYGNVGSSIYYALGLVALYALGLTPVTFVIAGLIFAFTAATYVEATVLYPEAGGSSSFARHAFNEFVSFLAAWAQMLTYIVTVAISAFFVPHYLGVFWDPLREGPADVIFGIGLVAALALLNIKGTEESARLNLVLAIADLLTQIVLVIIGLALVFNADLLVTQIDLGSVPSWSDFALGIAVGMVAYTGIETISNMAEEARDPSRTIPRGTLYVVLAVVGLYALLPAIALSAMPVVEGANGEFTTELATTFADDPVLGIVENIGLSAGAHRGARGLRRHSRRGDPPDRNQRGADRPLAADLLDGTAPPAPQLLAPDPPALQDPIRRHHRLLRRRDAGDGAGADHFPRHDLRLRRDPLVHRRAHLGRSACERRDRSPGDRSRRTARRCGRCRATSACGGRRCR